MRKILIVIVYVALVLPLTFTVGMTVIMVPSMLLAVTTGPIEELPTWIQWLTRLNMLLGIAGGAWLSWKAWPFINRDAQEEHVSKE